MRERVQASVAGGHVAVIGVWDPVSEELAEFFRATVSAAALRGRSVLAVTLAPDPVAILRGPQCYPAFQDVEYRLWFQAQCGVQSRVVVQLTRDEVEGAGAALLLDGIRRHVAVDELLLKPGQSLGRGARGTVATIRQYCAGVGVRVGVTGRHRPAADVEQARKHLAGGKLARTVELLAQRLYRARPPTGDLLLPWPPGTYTAVPMAVPLQTPLPTGTGLRADRQRASVEVRLTPCQGGSRLRWPAKAAPWLAFVTGPADARGAVTEAFHGREVGHRARRHG